MQLINNFNKTFFTLKDIIFSTNIKKDRSQSTPFQQHPFFFFDRSKSFFNLEPGPLDGLAPTLSFIYFIKANFVASTNASNSIQTNNTYFIYLLNVLSVDC